MLSEESDQNTTCSADENWDVTFCKTFDQSNMLARLINSKKELYSKGQVSVIETFEETINAWNLGKKFMFFIYYYKILVKNPIHYHIICSHVFENIILIQTTNKTNKTTPFKSNYFSRYLTSSPKFIDKNIFNLRNNLCASVQNRVGESDTNKTFLVATRENLEFYKDSHLFIKRLRFLKFNRKFVNSTNFEFMSKCKNLHTYETNYASKLPRIIGVKKLVIYLKRNSEFPCISRAFLKSIQTIVVYVDPPSKNESQEEFAKYMQKISRRIHQEHFNSYPSSIKVFVVRM